MRLLDRYLFRELLAPLAYCLGGFLLFWISWDLFNELQEMQDRKLHLLDVLEYAAAMTPEFLATILPIALLLALLYALAGHARHNEITAMRAAGASLWRICIPYFITGLAAGAVLFALNEYLVPRAAEWAWQIKTRHVQKPGDETGQDKFRGFNDSPAHRLWEFDEYRARTAEMVNPAVSQTLPDGTLLEVRAARAEFTNGTWTFFNASEKEIAQPGARLILSLQTNVLAMPEFTETPHQIEVEMKINAYEGIGKHKADISIADILSHLRFKGGEARGDSGWLLTELNSRLAAPWTCLVVVLIAIPFGAGSGRRSLFTGVAGSIFICFAYFLIQKVSYAFGVGGHLPGWLAAWLPNLIFGFAGLWLMVRVR
jgi:lipopolysaccharide export system permease protein